MEIKNPFRKEDNRRHHYLVCWEAMDNNNRIVKGHTEVNIPQPWGVGDIEGVLDYIASLNDGGVNRPTPTSVFYIGRY